MEAKELRMGNWVKGKGNTRRITTIKAPHLYDVSQFEPITITEEWLYRFGFKEDLSKLDPPETPNGNFWSEWVNGIITIDMPFYSFIFNYGEEEVQIKYVHQLQNLYFALTGEELQLNSRKQRTMNQEIREILEELPTITITVDEVLEMRKYAVLIYFEERWKNRFTEKNLQGRLNAIYGKVRKYSYTDDMVSFNVEFEN